jgi:2,4-dienoyl-CoA reductase-like NADH-dependent reductase (Old Yellow Enzyme family)
MEDKMTRLFEQTEINGMVLANRFVRSATWEGMAGEDGSVTPKLTDCMTNLAKGGIGLIVSSHTYVHRAGQAGPWQLGVYSDDLIPGLTIMADAVHKNNGKIVMQLAHAGFFANAKLTGQPPFAVSDVEGIAKTPRKELTADDIGEIVQAFGKAAERAKKAGFDGVQIHSAHGYLLSQFLSPAFNRRNDKFGGAIENRALALVETLRAVRNNVGRNYPVLVKMNSGDFMENGLTLEDSIKVGKMLEEGGIDAIELSGGVLTGGKLSPSRMGIHSEDKEAYFRQEAKAFRDKVNVPLILVGGNRSYNMAEHIIFEGIADYISMSRPLIREPGLINRWKSGDFAKSACLSDNQCFGPAMAGEGIYCVTEKKEKAKG